MNINIYGKEDCIWCTRAKMFLDRSGIDYTYSDIEKDTNAYENFASTGSRTVPAIIIDDKFIGGFNDLVAYLSVNGGAN